MELNTTSDIFSWPANDPGSCRPLRGLAGLNKQNNLGLTPQALASQATALRRKPQESNRKRSRASVAGESRLPFGKLAAEYPQELCGVDVAARDDADNFSRSRFFPEGAGDGAGAGAFGDDVVVLDHQA